MTRSSLLYYIFLIISVHIVFVSSDCVTYDVCYEAPTYSNYCPANSTTRYPQPLSLLDSHLQQQLIQKCPHLFAGGNNKLCCTGRQLEALFKGMSLPNSILQRCPACLDNFWKNWCEYTCSPNQADFVKVVTVETSSKTNLSYVTKVQYDISREFVDSMFNSCKDVQLASGGQALQLMCGRLKPNETCTVEKWLGFMGTRSIHLGIPTDIDYRYHNSDSRGSYMHVNTTRCDQAPRAGMTKCSRTDCPLVPIVQDFFPEDTGTQEPCRLLGIGCTVYFLILAVFVFVTIFICVFTIYFCRGEHGSVDKIRRAASESDWGAFGSVANWIPKQVEVNSGLFGEFVTRQSYLTCLFGVFLAVVCCSGLAFLTVTTNPVDMWAPPNSRTIQEKRFFDTNFGAFYRVQQIIMYPKKTADNTNKIGPIFEKEFFTEVFNVVNRIERIQVLVDNKNVTLSDICHRPMGPGYGCLINSPTNYFGHNVKWLNYTFIPPSTGSKGEEEDVFDYYDDAKEAMKDPLAQGKTYLDHLNDCIGNPYTIHSSFNISCLAPFGGPTFPYLVFGGDTENGSDFMKSSAVVISILLSGRGSMRKMLGWEEGFINLMKDYKHENVQLSFMAERSIQDEIRREGLADAYTVIIACILMVVYVIFALGQYTVENNRLSTIFVHSKILLGTAGMISIGAAIVSSIGVLSLYGMDVPTTAIVVQSFVTLILGSNRMFLTVRAMQSHSTFPEEAMSERLYRICSSVMPTMLTCAVAQGVIFCVGAFSPVPAVRSFSLMAALSIVFQFVFHCTVFLPLCVIDLRREENGKPEIFCCKKYQTETPEPVDGRGYVEEVMHCLAPYLMSNYVRVTVIGLVTVFFFISPVAFPWIELGLDQKMAVPEDSYMYVHFRNMEKYMNVGPPVYFVIQGDIDFSDKYWQDKMCTLGGCADDSVGAILAQAVDNPKKTYLTGEVLNWLDSYIEWISPVNDCCKIKTTAGKPEYCSSKKNLTENEKECRSCDKLTSDGRPSKNIFYKHLKQFTEDVPNEFCVQGGRAAFHDAIHLDPRGHVDSSYMMTFHVPLRTSSDFIGAMEGARMVSRKIEHALNNTVKVFPYSVFYVFYDQFLTIRTESAYQLVFAMTGLFLSVLLLNGLDAWSAVIIVLTCLFHLITQVVMMAIWRIEFNNISAVNLIMAVATSTEFTIPMVMAFLMSFEKTRLDRAKDAFVKAGPTIFCGVTLTMLMGTIMLAFAHSQFFKVFFFRMLLTIGLGGALCGLIFLPIVLSCWGPPSRKKPVLTQSCEIEHSSESRRLPINLLTSRRGGGDHSTDSYSKEVLDSLNPLLPPSTPARQQPRLD